MARSDMSPFARLLTSAAVIEPTELKAVLLSFVYFACLMASYFILRPVRDAMGTVYGVRHLQELFTGTFLVSFLVAAVYAGLASRIWLPFSPGCMASSRSRSGFSTPCSSAGRTTGGWRPGFSCGSARSTS